MKWVKLTLLEAGFLKDTITGAEELCWDERDQAIELLDAAVDNAVEEEIDG